MAELPSGTVTFLFTDIEGSTQLLKAFGGRYGELLAEQQRILRAAASAHGGHEVDTQGESSFVAFRRAKDAVAAAVDAQRDLAAHPWPEGAEVKVRMGLHTGEPQVGEERYVGIGVHKAARIAAAGHGGQVLLSSTTRELVEDELPPGVTIRDLGERRLKDLDRPERLSQLVVEGLQSDFDPLKTLDVELRRRRRLYTGAALIGVLAAAIAIPVFALGQGGSGGSTDVEPNSVAIIDPESNEVVDSIPNVGVRPSAIAVGQGAVWVGNLDDRTLTRVDPLTRTVTAHPPVPATPTGIAVGFGAVWVAFGLLGSVARVDPSVNAVTATVEDAAPHASGGSIAVGEGAVWFASAAGLVARIDPSKNMGVPPTGVAGTLPSAVATGFDAVWVANTGDNVVRINPRTNGVVRPISVGGGPRGIAVGEGAVWVTSEADDLVFRIDAGAVWVANSADGTVSRIDPETNKVVETIAVGNRPVGIAVGGGSVWVSVQQPAT